RRLQPEPCPTARDPRQCCGATPGGIGWSLTTSERADGWISLIARRALLPRHHEVVCPRPRGELAGSLLVGVQSAGNLERVAVELVDPLVDLVGGAGLGKDHVNRPQVLARIEADDA